MKIAVQFYGHLRTFEKCAQSIRTQLLDIHNCDVFIHTWSETEHRTQTWHNQKSKISPVNDTTISKIQKLYLPKKICIEQQKVPLNDVLIPCLHNPKKFQISLSGLNFMLYSQQKVNDLRKKYQQKNKVKYDLVIMLRPDIMLNTPLPLEAIQKQHILNQNKNIRYAIARFLENKDFPIVCNNASDILYFSTPDIMDNIVDCLEKINFKKNKNAFWNPETFIDDTLSQNGIYSKYLTYTYNKDWKILRPRHWEFNRKKIISLRIRKNILSLKFLSFLPFSVFKFDTNLLSKFKIQLYIGNIE